MARSPVTVQTPLGPYPALPLVADSADLAMTALTGSSGSNGNQAAFGNYNRLLCIFQNTDATAKTFTISSLAGSNTFNRSGDITGYSLAAGELAHIFVERNGWIQSDGNLYFEANSALMKAAIIGIN